MKIKPATFLELEDILKQILANSENVTITDRLLLMGGNPDNYMKRGKLDMPLYILAVLVNEYMLQLAKQAGMKIVLSHENIRTVHTTYNGKKVTLPTPFIKYLLVKVLNLFDCDPILSRLPKTSKALLIQLWSSAEVERI